jgi:type I restriction enzyme S subunit
LEQYKKAVMQQIFSQKLRFKDENGRAFGAWEEKELKEIGSSFNGLTGKSGDDFGDGSSYITYKQIFSDRVIDASRFCKVQINEGEKQNKVKYGDIFFTISSETPNEVGFHSVLLSEVENVYLNSFCFGYRINSFDILDPLFAYYIFGSAKFRREVIKLAQGSTRYNISKSAFMEIKVSFPSRVEQQRIAGFLGAVDEKLAQAKAKLDAVKQYKQGLLQQMFV